MEKRLEWAEEISDWTDEDFNSIFFTDESLLCCEK